MGENQPDRRRHWLRWLLVLGAAAAAVVVIFRRRGPAVAGDGPGRALFEPLPPLAVDDEPVGPDPHELVHPSVGAVAEPAVVALEPAAVAAEPVAAPASVAAVEPAAVAAEPVAVPASVAAVHEAGRWSSHPGLARLVRVMIVAVPMAFSIATATVLSRTVRRPEAGAGLLAWWAMLLVGSTIALVAVDRLARKLLPLAALLRLSMVFPDQAPARFSVAFRSGSTRQLDQRLRHAKEHGVEDEPAQAAERILALVGALSTHDRATRGHSERVRAFNDLLAEEMGLSPEDRDRLRWSALLHDIGKLHVRHDLLNKPGAPTQAEWAELHSHPEEGAKLAAPLAGWLGEWSAAIEQHHERWDGAGYPKGLAGEEISLGARIVAVADAYEVMTAPRPYRRPVSAQAARQELARCAGSHFDPAVVRAFLNISLGQLRKTIGPIAWLAQLPFIGAVPQFEAAAAAAGRTALSAAGTTAGMGALVVSGMVHSHPVHTHADITGVTDAGATAVVVPHTHAVPAPAPRPAAVITDNAGPVSDGGVVASLDGGSDSGAPSPSADPVATGTVSDPALTPSAQPSSSAGAPAAASPAPTSSSSTGAAKTPPGQANKPASPPGQATPPAQSTPPGQANNSTPPGQSGNATPPGQSNKPTTTTTTATSPSSSPGPSKTAPGQAKK